MSLTFGSLFAGIGGMDIAFERAGMTPAFNCEIDPKCQEILKRHWPDVPQFGDITQFDGMPWRGKVDVICGGSPCQDFSVAGQRAGIEGARSGLFFEYARIIEEIQPEWVVWENVPGVFSSNAGRDFAAILNTLDKLRYVGAWTVLDAQYFGLAQRRKRVFLVARLGAGGASEVLLEPEGVCGDPPTRSREGTIASALSASGVGTYGGDEHHNLVVPRSVSLRGREGGVAAELGDEVSCALRAAGGGSSKAHVLAYSLAENQRGEVRLSDCSSQLTTGGGKPGQGYLAAWIPPLAVRRLTPTECARLQGFPDNHLDGMSDTTKYKQLGNAVAVPVVSWIAKRLVEVASMTKSEWYQKKGLTLP